MSDKTSRAGKIQRPYRVSPRAQSQLRQQRMRNWRRAQQGGFLSRRRYWVRCQRAYCRNLIRGDLVTHRRMFGISHKSAQPGERPAGS